MERKGSEPGAPERWHPPRGDGRVELIVEPAGPGLRHVLTVDEISERLECLPARLVRNLETVQLSRMTRKRSNFPCYGMQWGSTIYLYPIEDTLVETFVEPPTPRQQIETRMFGGVWTQDGGLWRLTWTPETIRDFYLNNVLLHELGHIVDGRNRNPRDRERFADWFAIEFGYRPTR
jgi:hypothetical protein